MAVCCFIGHDEVYDADWEARLWSTVEQIVTENETVEFMLFFYFSSIIHNGEAQSEIIPELQIIDPETFERAQKIMGDRTTHHAETPLNLKGKSLLVGNVYCGHCRNRLTLTTSGRQRTNKYGEIVREVRSRYQSYPSLSSPSMSIGTTTLEIEFNVSFEDFRTMATEYQVQDGNKQPVVYVTA